MSRDERTLYLKNYRLDEYVEKKEYLNHLINEKSTGGFN